MRGNELSVRVYGPQSAVTYTRESVTTGTIEPPAPEVRENASESELRAPKAGLTSEGYLICREAGKPAAASCCAKTGMRRSAAWCARRTLKGIARRTLKGARRGAEGDRAAEKAEKDGKNGAGKAAFGRIL